jgi:prolyl-tRNA synthetase
MQIAPFDIHLVGLDLKNEEVKSKVQQVYQALQEKKIEVLFDDREDISAGEKFSDADLIGIPIRLVVSKRTGERIEFKKRNESEAKLLSLHELLTKR